MNKILKRWAYVAGMGAVVLLGACDDDIDPLVEDLNLNRVLTPLELEARVQNKTEVKLNWSKSIDAEKYVVEIHEDSLVFEHPVKTEEVLPTDILIIKGLEGETLYSVRVKGVNEKKDDSKWASLTFRTDKENIMNAVADEDIETNAATVRWTAGLAVTHLTYKASGETGDPVKVDLDDAAKAVGAYQLTGLTGETTYEVKLYNGVKQRGSVSFKTLVDIGNATPVHPEDDLKAILDAAQDGDVLALFPGEYELDEYQLTQSIALKGVYPADKPVIKGRLTFSVDVASLNLNNIILDGQNSIDNFIEFKAEKQIGEIRVENCVIRNYTKHVIYNTNKAKVGSITLSGCIIDNIKGDGGDGFDFRDGALASLTVENSTLSNSFRAMLRMQVSCDVTFRSCTFYKVCMLDNSNNSGLFRISGGNLNVSKCLFAETGVENPANAGAGNWCKSSGNMKAEEHYAENYYSSCHNLWVGLYTSAPEGVSEVGDPGFADAAKGDFTISNEDLIYKGIGDPRWIK